MKSDTTMPKHVAIIMDGNRRWAVKNGLPKNLGHKKGYERFKEIADYCNKIGIETLTVYAFSTENWKRSELEVRTLMDLLRVGILSEQERLHKDNVRFKVIGRVTDLPEDIQKSIFEAENLTKNNTGGQINLAISYGGRAEIVDAVKKLIDDGISADEVEENSINNRLYTAGQNEPDLIIRTGGDFRLSNFLLWQSAYSELYFTPTLWPDFDQNELDKAIAYYKDVKRNFGK